MTLQPGARPVPNYPDYVLFRKLGAGAFGEVWHAHGPGGIEVALKFIPLDAHIWHRELHSLELMRRIRHPNLVSLFGAWHHDNCLILAMELCERTLQDRLAETLGEKRPGIPLDELLTYMSDAANGLDALHAKHVAHRDIKPANLLLLGSGVKVADYGLAKALEQTVASNSGAGTLAYTAPECFKGQLTQQSDQYSLAVTYYHLRTGRLLFGGNQAQITYAHLELEPDLSALPYDERGVLERALLKEPGRRWPNCKLFVETLADREFYSSLFRRAESWLEKGDYDKAFKDYDEAIRHDCSNEADYYIGGSLARRAWPLATSHDEKLRDGKLAIRLATKACELTDWRMPWELDALAAACAETGQFEEAVRYQMKAMECAGDWGPECWDRLLQRLEVYKQRKPFRQNS